MGKLQIIKQDWILKRRLSAILEPCRLIHTSPSQPRQIVMQQPWKRHSDWNSSEIRVAHYDQGGVKVSQSHNWIMYEMCWKVLIPVKKPFKNGGWGQSKAIFSVTFKHLVKIESIIYTSYPIKYAYLLLSLLSEHFDYY